MNCITRLETFSLRVPLRTAIDIEKERSTINKGMIFEGFFDKGSKLRMDPFTDMGDGYWKEMDENTQFDCG